MRRSGLWRNSDYVRLWGAATISTYGSLVSRTALPFTAILLLDADAWALSALRIAELLPGFLIGLFAGAWVDRLRRRPILIATDLTRAALLVTIPAVAFFGLLSLNHLYLIAALVSALSVGFDVAFQSFLPSLVERDDLIEANSKLSAASSVSEAAAFSSSGWLVQLLSAPLAMLVDALTFLASAALVLRIHTPERSRGDGGEETQSVLAEVGAGLRAVWREPVLRGLTLTSLALNLSFGLVGTVFLLYVNREVGFDPGILGMIFAVGGVSSFLGAMIVGRLPRFAIGSVMIVSLLLAAVGQAFTPLATAANLTGMLFLIGQQIVADAALTVYDINLVSLRQAIAPDQILGRVIASLRVIEVGAVLVGTVAAGYLGETIGLRNTLWLGVAASVLAAVILTLSPVRKVQRMPELPAGVTA
ncbi:MAG: MFS transporter [Thermomicrobiales bacterium]